MKHDKKLAKENEGLRADSVFYQKQMKQFQTQVYKLEIQIEEMQRNRTKQLTYDSLNKVFKSQLEVQRNKIEELESQLMKKSLELRK